MASRGVTQCAADSSRSLSDKLRPVVTKVACTGLDVYSQQSCGKGCADLGESPDNLTNDLGFEIISVLFVVSALIQILPCQGVGRNVEDVSKAFMSLPPLVTP